MRGLFNQLAAEVWLHGEMGGVIKKLPEADSWEHVKGQHFSKWISSGTKKQVFLSSF